MKRTIIASLLALAAAANARGVPRAVPDASAQVMHYKGALDNVKFVFVVAPLMARLRPGNILNANSLDCFVNGIQKPATGAEIPRTEVGSAVQACVNQTAWPRT